MFDFESLHVLNKVSSEIHEDKVEAKLIKESYNSILPIKISPTFLPKYLEEEDKKLTFTGGKYIVSKNIAFLSKFIKDLSTLSTKILFIPKMDHLVVCTYNTSTSLFSRTTFSKTFFVNIDTLCLEDNDKGCCISSETAVSFFNLAPEIFKISNYLSIELDPTKDFVDMILFGSHQVSDFTRINQLSFNIPVENYTSPSVTGEFTIICHVEMWEGLFKMSKNSFSQLIFCLKKDSLFVTTKQYDTTKMSTFTIEINAENLIKYDIKNEVILTFDFNEFLMACNIVSKLSKKFVLEYIDGESPLRMSLYEPDIIDFEIFFNAKLNNF